MLFCFIDESNTPPKPTKRDPRPYFVMAGVFVPIGQWPGMAAELQKLKERPEFRVRGEIKWRYFGGANNDPKNTVRHLDADARDRFREGLFDIMKKRNSVKIVAAVTKISEFYRAHPSSDDHDLYAYTYKTVTERFQYHLQDLTRQTGSEHLGIFVADHRGRDDDERMRRHHQKLLHATSRTISNYKNVAESLFLAPSHHSIGVQLADMAAGAVARYYNSADKRWFDFIKPAFRTKPDGDINGYGLAKVPNTW